MDLTAKTKIDDLLNQYPFLEEFFIAKSPKFKNLKNPIMRKTIGKVATLAKVAAMGELDLNELLEDISREIQEKAGRAVSLEDKGSSQIPGDPKAREEALKGIIRDLHKGVDMEILKDRFRKLIQHVSPSEIANMEQRLIEEGLPEMEVKKLCDVHVAVFKEALERSEMPGAPPGHPVHTFMLENRASERLMDRIEEILRSIGKPPEDEKFDENRQELSQLIEDLSQIHVHYLRKENQLFPLLEIHDVSGPTQVMWAIHDDIRALLKKAKARIATANRQEAVESLEEVLGTIREMIYKEEHILFPMALETLSDPEWVKVRQGEDEIGYAWVQPEADWSPGAAEGKKPLPKEERIRLNTGYVTRDLVDLMLTHLPVDLTLVDKEDRVAYYSSGKERIFPRSPGIIGREVQRCHPPSSVHIVNKLLEAFKSGERDVAEFWIQLGGKFIHIRYFALRNAQGEYEGCLEVSQNLTEIRRLQGEKRLIDWK
jgi:uncharacterized protein